MMVRLGPVNAEVSMLTRPRTVTPATWPPSRALGSPAHTASGLHIGVRRRIFKHAQVYTLLMHIPTRIGPYGKKSEQVV
jgi:hypothetical protein